MTDHDSSGIVSEGYLICLPYSIHLEPGLAAFSFSLASTDCLIKGKDHVDLYVR